MVKGRARCIKGGRIVLENQILLESVLIFEDTILSVVDEKEFFRHHAAPDMEIIDAKGKYVSPGFIDIHTHGAGGRDAMDGRVSELQELACSVARSGVTGFLPTTISMGWGNISRALDSIRTAMTQPPLGARILGAHLEGPFINPRYAGAHRKEYVQKPDLDRVVRYQDVLRIITMAPELDPESIWIKHMKDQTQIVLSMGHTEADYDTAAAAIKAGISSATHLFNAMPTIHHRRPGPVVAILNSGIFFELIADTRHVHPAMFPLLLGMSGRQRMILVTDAMRAAGMQPGAWELGGQKVIVDEQTARLKDGTLAGSILQMNQAVRNMLDHTDLSMWEAVNLASLNPARLLGLDQTKGSLRPGKNADILIFDEQLNIQEVYVEGQQVY
ncbi:MAG TPA: N-acetylglucosamine-6-phosphate deacetylase [Clostridiales bacterium]|nr:N-acetylglucosamine-6-phosphate deacetylase [Clostridiales bacterium]